MSDISTEPEEAPDPIVVKQEDDEQRPQSLMEQLRAKRQEIADTRETYIILPGFDTVAKPLAAKYRLVERQETEEIGKKLRRQKIRDRNEFQMLAVVDVLIQALEGFYVLHNGQYVALKPNDEPNAEHIVAWNDLAEALGYQNGDGNFTRPTKARDALYFVFGGNEFAILQHGVQLNRWFANTDADVDTEFLGEV